MASSIPPPSPKQAKIIWLAVTAISLLLFLAAVGVVVWGLGWVVQRLSTVLLPLAIAGIMAYLLDPVVDYLERKKIRRAPAILLVFFLGLAFVAGAMTTIIPGLISETRDLSEQIPTYAKKIVERYNDWVQHTEWLQKSPWASRLKGAWNTDLKETIQEWATKAAPAVSAWFLAKAGKIASWFGFLVGIAMVPVYLFYLLLEKSGIKRSWTDYLPIHESQAKHEVVFIIQSINDYLILFFRGQILVALCDGVLLTIGFFAIGLNYALLLGVTAGLLSIVPFLGIVLSLVPALLLAAVQYGDWLHPALVLGVFGLVQFLEGFVISPKIMGDRVGLHPLTIILAVMVGTTLMGGIIGGILAIPLTAALRVLMFRYIWTARVGPLIEGEN
jgi:predicted PurR-regulated permease PerM